VWLAFLLALLFHFFRTIAETLLLAYAAAILAVALNAATSRLPLNRKWVAGIVGIAFLGGVVALLWFGAPAVVAQFRDLAGDLPRMQAQLKQWAEWVYQQTGIRVPLGVPGGGGGAQRALPQMSGGAVLGRAAGLLQVILLVLIVLFGGLYALASPNQRLLTPLLRTVPRSARPAVYRILDLLGKRLVGWLKGTGIAMLAVGALSTVAFYLIGVPNALALGLLNGLVEFIPIFGPWIGGTAATLVAFIADPVKGAWVAVAALAIQQIEANVITPWAMSREAEVHPFVTLFALLLFGGLFGFLGIFLALPLVIFFWTVVQVLWVERTIDTDQDRIAPVVQE
ncbi:MAG TPA: AI-2E family transporter, partial [Longimicrobiaceae bacterium]|nr:AI-2E family transporter [Longimicrobiaceae bacterium]